MQELIDYIEMNPIVFNKELLLKLKELTFKEKEQIIEAHTNAYLIGEDDISVDDANEASIKYYNQTYNQNK